MSMLRNTACIYTCYKGIWELARDPTNIDPMGRGNIWPISSDFNVVEAELAVPTNARPTVVHAHS
jgi:hypothetical protein